MNSNISLACSFCGNADENKLINVKDQQKFRVWCELCGALGPPGETRDEAAEKWNVQAGGLLNEMPETVVIKAVALRGLVGRPLTEEQQRIVRAKLCLIFQALEQL